jgi:hypothetical protein
MKSEIAGNEGPALPRAGGWLRTRWPDLTGALAVLTLTLLILFVLPQNLLLFGIWVCLPVYFLHQFEEYVYPGGFLSMLNRTVSSHAALPDGSEPMSTAMACYINVGIIWVLFPLSAGIATFAGPAWGLWIPYFTVINGASHLARAITTRAYNPGLAVSVCLNIPVGLAVLSVAIAAGITSLAVHIASCMVAAALMAVVITAAIRGAGRIRHELSEESSENHC